MDILVIIFVVIILFRILLKPNKKLKKFGTGLLIDK